MESLAALKSEINCAFGKGYRVVVGPVWNSSETELADAMTSLGKKDFAVPLHALLHSYRGTPVGDPGSSYYMLTRPSP